MMDEGESFGDIVKTIGVSPKNEIWCGKANGEVFIWNGSYVPVDVAPLNYPVIGTIAVDDDGKVWFGSDRVWFRITVMNGNIISRDRFQAT